MDDKRIAEIHQGASRFAMHLAWHRIPMPRYLVLSNDDWNGLYLWLEDHDKQNEAGRLGLLVDRELMEQGYQNFYFAGLPMVNVLTVLSWSNPETDTEVARNG